jgi:hypothetical protein
MRLPAIISMVRIRAGLLKIRASSGASLAAILFALAFLPALGSAQIWRTEVVDNGAGHEVGEFSSLAIDVDGNLHVAYWDRNADALLYAFRSTRDKQWSRMVVDKDGTFVTLAVDSAGRPHFAYVSKNETGLHYAYWDGTKWKKEIVDSGHINYFTSIQVDAAGHPMISYYLYHLPSGEYSLHLKYAYFDGKAWYIQTVDQRDHTGKINSLAMDRQGNPHIAYSYFANGSGDLFYAHWEGSKWRFGSADVTATENSYLAYGTSIALDSVGHPHIAYFDDTKKTVKYVSWTGTHWVPETVDQLVGIEVLDHVSLKIDHQDRPHIAYYDAGLGALKYAFRARDGWQRQVVDHEGNVGLRPSLYLDGHDEPYISYQDLGNHSLRLAHRESSVAAAASLKK